MFNNLPYQQVYSKREKNNSSPKPEPLTETHAQTEVNATNNTMNYETTPTPSFKPQQLNNNNNTSSKFYPTSDNDWVVSTPSTADSFSNRNNNSTDAMGGSNNNNVDDEMQQRHMQQLFDKKRRRRESHNAVERRRRDNINERIFELSTLLPERDADKNNKGTILRKSVDHIRLLHDKVNQYQNRVQELENMLDMYRMRWGDLTSNNTTTGHNQLQPQLDISGIQPHLHHHHYSQRDT